MLIAIDHGNKQMKTVHCPPFVSGLTQSATEPYGKDILKYKDLYYTLCDGDTEKAGCRNVWGGDRGRGTGKAKV